MRVAGTLAQWDSRLPLTHTPLRVVRRHFSLRRQASLAPSHRAGSSRCPCCAATPAGTVNVTHASSQRHPRRVRSVTQRPLSASHAATSLNVTPSDLLASPSELSASPPAITPRHTQRPLSHLLDALAVVDVDEPQCVQRASLRVRRHGRRGAARQVRLHERAALRR
jgi:hypothetical protein